MRAVQLEMNLGVCAGIEFAFTVIYIDFDEQGARGGIDGSGGAHDFALKGAARHFAEGKSCRDAGEGGEGVSLGHVDVDAQNVFGGQMKELTTGSISGAGIDQRADIDIAGGDDSIEGCVDV